MSKELKDIFNNTKKEGNHSLHNFHAFPCKFPAFIPRKIIQKFGKKGDIVFDPFVGSGTTLLEATLLGHSSFGSDINPLSCLLSQVKAKPLSPNLLNKIDRFCEELPIKYKKSKNIKNFHYENIDHWFQGNVIKELSFIKLEILKLKEQELKDLFFIIFSSILVRVSNQDSNTRYVAINKDIKDLETIRIFIQKSIEIKSIYLDFFQKTKDSKVKLKVFQADSRDLSKLNKNSVDLIITSPPYANTYDYYLYHKHRKHWLDMDVKYAQLNEIGSRHEFSSLKEDPQKWEQDIKKCLIEIKRIIKKGGKIFIIIGDSVIDKKLIKMNKIMKKISKEVGLKFMDIASAPMSKHSRMFNPSFSSLIKKEEHLIFLEK